MPVQQIEDAVLTLRDATSSELRRVNAAHFLAKHPDPLGIDALVRVLNDYDPGVRWAATNALAELGEAAMPPLLEELIVHTENAWLRHEVLRVIRHNKRDTVRQKAVQLRRELERPATDLDATRAASRQLLTLLT